MIDELFSDTVVICHHEKFFTFRGMPKILLQKQPPCATDKIFRIFRSY